MVTYAYVVEMTNACLIRDKMKLKQLFGNGVLILVGILIIAFISFFAIIGLFATIIPENKNYGIRGIEEKFLGYFGKKWAVLVSGSDNWSNYRHQADICHAYQILIENEIPKENIITMMVDDIVNNEENPRPGVIINRPNGANVYKGVTIDYKGTDVTPENFLNIITGNKKAMKGIGSGKVVDGGRFDHVFINFVDHGGAGVLGFPNGTLMADDLNNALNQMYKKKSYSKVLLYIEACESGSMFDGILSDDKNVIAVTAAAPREYSYATYCENSQPYFTCLGDLFSVKWMEHLDENSNDTSSKKRTVFNVFTHVRHNVEMSNVMIYGDFDVGREKLSTFIGYRKASRNQADVPKFNTIQRKSIVPSREVSADEIKLRVNGHKLSSLERQHLGDKMRHNKAMRLIIDKAFQSIYSFVVMARPDIQGLVGEFDKPNYLQLSLDMFPCYKGLLKTISESCFSVPRNPYTFGRLRMIANFCVVDKNIHETAGNLVKRACAIIPKNILNIH